MLTAAVANGLDVRIADAKSAYVTITTDLKIDMLRCAPKFGELEGQACEIVGNVYGVPTAGS
jgi:hypothetical protein